jgi:putative phosphoribosyl transferase
LPDTASRRIEENGKRSSVVAKQSKGEVLNFERPVLIPSDGAVLSGALVLPEDAAGIVLVAHASGSGRLCPRNRFLARELEARGLATLQVDLLTPEEEVVDQQGGQFRFDIQMLARRLGAAARWVSGVAHVRSLPMGYFGSGTAASAALVAAAQDPEPVRAIVSSGGRPDLAGRALGYVETPTLLLVGETDQAGLELNRQGLLRLGCTEKQLVVVPGASDLFGQLGALDEAAGLAGDWIMRYLGAARMEKAEALAG